MKQKNTPLYVIVGVLALLFVVPFVLALISTLIYGEFAPPADLLTGLYGEIDANFALALLLTGLPLLMVWAVERALRRSGAGGPRSQGLTLALLVLLMLAVTAVPLVSYLRPLANVPPAARTTLLGFVALPLLIVTFAVVILIPELVRRRGERPPEKRE